MAFKGIELVGNKKDQQPSRLQYTKTFRHYFCVAVRMLEDFDHGDGIETLRGKRQICSRPLYSWNGFPKRLQMRHLNVNPANGLRSPRQFCRVTTIATSEIEDSHASQVQRLIYFSDAFGNGVRSVASRSP